MMTLRAASSTTFLRGSLLQASRIFGTWSAQGASLSALLHFLIFGLWCACRVPPAIRSCKLASAALLLLILLLSQSPSLALGLQARPPPLSPLPNAKRAYGLTGCLQRSAHQPHRASPSRQGSLVGWQLVRCVVISAHCPSCVSSTLPCSRPVRWKAQTSICSTGLCCWPIRISTVT